MLGLRRYAFGAVIALCLVTPAAAIEPDDLPWDEIDRLLKEQQQEDAPDDEAPDSSSGPTAGPSAAPANPAATAAPKPETPTPAEGPAIPPQPPVDANAQPKPANPIEAARPDAPAFPLPVRAYFETRSGDELRGTDDADRTALMRFYYARASDALWVDKAGYTSAAKDLIAAFAQAADWGLKSDSYYVPDLTGAVLTEDNLAAADVKLSLAAMAYARHARGDRISDPTAQLSSYIDRKPNLVDRAELLTALVAAPSKKDYLSSLHPRHPQFELLRAKLLNIRATAPDPAPFIPKGKKLRPGQSHPHIALIRQRLRLPASAPNTSAREAGDGVYDDRLAGAVVAFKEKHGIEPKDPVITQALRNALNRDAPVTEDLILTNMEQWRWMPDDLGAFHVAVNIPEFVVRVIKDGEAVHSERVITGQVDTQTPLFSDLMRTIVLQPPWIVPDSIKVNELLPRLRAGANPIAGRGLVMKRNGRTIRPSSVDWYVSDIRHYDIQQPPGPSNVLGVVKFMFPNKHAVYLHDTPTKKLFEASVRTFSHGCVRVRDPVRLAEVLLAAGKNWDAKEVRAQLESGPEDNAVTLDAQIPVHITYFTAWVDEAGEVRTFADVYGHEKRIKLALAGRWSEIERGPDHLAPSIPDAVTTSYDGGGGDSAYNFYDQRRRYARRGGYRYVVPPRSKGPLSSYLSELFGP